MKTIEERAIQASEGYDDQAYSAGLYMGYKEGAKEQKVIDEKRIKLLEEDRNAFIAFCHNIINGMYISVVDASQEQLEFLEGKAMEE